MVGRPFVRRPYIFNIGGNMITGRLHSVETFGAVDGPGIRTVFFLQGCPARCLYCHNPDTWAIHLGRPVMPSELVSIAKRGVPYYGEEGGVTFSGGEPLAQGEFLIETMKQLKEEGIKSVIDTSGTFVDRYTKPAIQMSQLLLLDIKHTEPETFEKISGLNQRNLMETIEIANEVDAPVWVRQVIVPDLNDSEQNVAALREFARKNIRNLQKIELLGYHNMALEKWANLGLEYQLQDAPSMDKKRLEVLNALL